MVTKQLFPPEPRLLSLPILWELNSVLAVRKEILPTWKQRSCYLGGGTGIAPVTAVLQEAKRSSILFLTSRPSAHLYLSINQSYIPHNPYPNFLPSAMNQTVNQFSCQTSYWCNGSLRCVLHTSGVGSKYHLSRAHLAGDAT